MTVTERARAAPTPVVRGLSALDRFLSVWIVVAMAVGLGIGRYLPG